MMINAAWAQVVHDVCARRQPEELEQPAAVVEFEEPLFASHPPTNGLTPALQAIAAMIDEEHERPDASRPTKRKAESLGEAQVCLALTGLGADAQPPPQRKRVRADAATGMMDL